MPKKISGRATKPPLKTVASRVRKVTKAKTTSLKSPSLPLKRRIARFFARRPRLSLLFGLGIVTLVLAGTATGMVLMDQTQDSRSLANSDNCCFDSSWPGGPCNVQYDWENGYNAWQRGECNAAKNNQQVPQAPVVTNSQKCYTGSETARACRTKNVGELCESFSHSFYCEASKTVINGQPACGCVDRSKATTTTQQGAAATGSTNDQTAGVYAPAGKKLNGTACTSDGQCLSGSCQTNPSTKQKICAGIYSRDNCQARGGQTYCSDFHNGTYCAKTPGGRFPSSCLPMLNKDGYCRTDPNSYGFPLSGNAHDACFPAYRCLVGQCQPLRSITCSDGYGPTGCPTGSYCSESKTCREKKQFSETCRDHFQCKSNVCSISGTCL